MSEPGTEPKEAQAADKPEPEKEVSETIATLKAAAADLKTNGNGTSDKKPESEKPDKPVTNGSANGSGNSDDDSQESEKQTVGINFVCTP